MSHAEQRYAVSEFNVVSENELRPVLAKLAHLQWPVPFDDAAGVLADVGWVLQNQNVGRTGFDISLPTFDIIELGGELSRAIFPVTDVVDDSDDAGVAVLREAFRKVVDVVSACLGCKPTGPTWGYAGVKWDLPNGGQISVPEGFYYVEIQVVSKRLADLERGEIRLGIDPNNEDEPIW